MKEKIKERLLSSPLFNLSLSSKELFHSNLLAWIGEQYPDLFVAICKELGCKAQWQDQTWSIKRELLNLDLCVQLDDDGKHIPFVLENKVKSIPRKLQLDEYANKVKPAAEDDLVLLTLATEFPDRQAIEDEGRWNIRNYGQLAEAISKHKHLYVKDSYHLALMEDYCQFIQSLHTLAKSWRVHEADTFLLTKADKDFCNELRIGDLQDKIWYAQLFAILNQCLTDALGAKIVSGLSIEEIKRDEYDLNKVYTNWGFTHGQGFLEAKMKITTTKNKSDYVLLVQIQGNKYCRGIEWTKRGSGTHQKFWELTQKEHKISPVFFQLADNPPSFPPICVDAKKKIAARKHKDGIRTYNTYGDRFLYQSKKIREDATVREVMEAIFDDLLMMYVIS